jgi:hypothetical protein
MRRVLAVLPVFFVSFLYGKSAWALYGQPMVVTVADWVEVLGIAVIIVWVFWKVGFPSVTRFRVSIAMMLANALALAVSLGFVAYAFWATSFEAVEIGGAIWLFLWLCSIPASVLVVCLLSKRAKGMAVIFLAFISVFYVTELGLNYSEIDGYLSDAESSGYRRFRHGTGIRNYLEASGIEELRLYPRERTRKVLLAMLGSDAWTDRHDAAVGLVCLKDRSVVPALVACLRNQDAEDDEDQARKACAVTLQKLLSGDFGFSAYRRIDIEYERDPAKLFERLEKEAAQRK